ncbi:MAG: serine/threonine-protein kinase [Myxococcota bacterium]
MVNSETGAAGLLAAYDLFEGTPYRTLQRLKAGGMGEVFLVQHRATQRELVAKLLHERLASDPRLLERVRIEAQALGQLQHAHIVTVVGFEQTRTGRPFIVMEHLQGRSLAEELRERVTLPILEALAYAGQALSGLAAAHELGLVHRDVKPDNLFICREGDGAKYLKLLDFGVARVMPGVASIAPLPNELQTEAGVVLGTPRFVSPEAATGLRVDHRADIYSLALVLYTMITGRGPFDHQDGDAMLLTAQASEAAMPPSAFVSEPFPLELDAIILKALAKNPGERFQTADEFRAQLENAAELLRRPSGWLQTTLFNAAQRLTDDDAPTPADPSGEVGAEDIRSNGARSDLTLIGERKKACAAVDDAQEAHVVALEPLSRARFASSVLVTAFVLAVVISGFASMGLMSLLGHR